MDKLEILEDRLKCYYEAEKMVLSGQEYKIGSRSLKRADLSEITNMITKLEKDLAVIKNGGKNKAVIGVPLDI